jgi:hypothetical protein
MNHAMLAALCFATLLAACGRSGEAGADNAATAKPSNAAAPATDYVAAIRTMDPKLRRATFLRAIRDAQQPCQDVVAEQEGRPVNGQASWIAQCDDGSGYVIAVQPDGNAKVMNALRPTPIRR